MFRSAANCTFANFAEFDAKTASKMEVAQKRSKHVSPTNVDGCAEWVCLKIWYPKVLKSNDVDHYSSNYSKIAIHVGTNPMFRDSCYQTQAVGIADSLLEPLGAAGSAAGTVEPPWCLEIFIE